MHYEFILSKCTTLEAMVLWLNLGIMVVAMIGFGMMVVNINNRNLNFLYMLSIGALLMFFPTRQERIGILGRRIFFISVFSFMFLSYIFSKSNMCSGT
jgi:hypothetical protein